MIIDSSVLNFSWIDARIKLIALSNEYALDTIQLNTALIDIIH
jgi:hypothetical protein